MCVCGIYTWDCELEQSESLVNHACILVSIAGCLKRGVCVCGNIHRGQWNRRVLITCEPRMNPEVTGTLDPLYNAVFGSQVQTRLIFE